MTDADTEVDIDVEGGTNEERHGAVFWTGFAIGTAVMAFGVRGAFQEAAATHPRDFFVWVVGAGLVHDLLVAPVICLVGFVLARFLAEPWRTPVRGGLIVSALVLAVGWPSLRMYGRDHVPDNRSVQPLDYATAVSTVLAAVWIGVGIWVVLRARVHHAADRR